MSVSSRLARWLVRLEELDPSKIELGLERTRLVYERLEIPPPALTILVAGTNGKGSVSHFLSCLLSQQSRRVGLYTSPHLHRFNERIAIEGEPVSDRLLVEAFDRIEAVRGQTPLTYFEFTTLAALVCFEHASVDCRVMEIGLGGRLDAVNVLEPDAAVLTNVGLDHQQWLGSSREQIG
ncbi:MAG: Mur ligase family protein, partial [Pseudomonadota bacterium]